MAVFYEAQAHLSKVYLSLTPDPDLPPGGTVITGAHVEAASIPSCGRTHGERTRRSSSGIERTRSLSPHSRAERHGRTRTKWNSGAAGSKCKCRLWRGLEAAVW